MATWPAPIPREFLQLPLGIRAWPVYRSTVAARVGGVGCGNRYRSSRRIPIAERPRARLLNGPCGHISVVGTVGRHLANGPARVRCLAGVDGGCGGPLACMWPWALPMGTGSARYAGVCPAGVDATTAVLPPTGHHGHRTGPRGSRLCPAGSVGLGRRACRSGADLAAVRLACPRSANSRGATEVQGSVRWGHDGHARPRGSPAARHHMGRALRAMVLGASNSTVVGQMLRLETHVPLGVLVVLARGLPIILSATVAWCALRRLGPAVREPLPLLSLVATSFSLRLVFEVNFLYYFMPLAVSLVLMDVIRRRIRWYLVIWMVLSDSRLRFNSWGFDPTSQPWDLNWREVLALSLLAAALAVVLVEAVRARARWSVVASLVAAGLAMAKLPPRGSDGVLHPLPDWLWMLTLLVAGIAMAVEPLISLALSRSSPTWHESGSARIGLASPVVGKSASPAGSTLSPTRGPWVCVRGQRAGACPLTQQRQTASSVGLTTLLHESCR